MVFMDEAKRERDIVSEAVAFAASAHEGQLRKGGAIPYIVHPMEAATIAARLTDDGEVIAAALLHDVVEDTDVTIDEVHERFGPRVAGIVAAESEDKQREIPAHLSWDARKRATIDHIASCDDEGVLIVCLADKLSNIRSMVHDHWVVGDMLWERFNMRDPAKHAWYYRSIAEALEPVLKGTDAFLEFVHLVDTLFGGQS